MPCRRHDSTTRNSPSHSSTDWNRVPGCRRGSFTPLAASRVTKARNLKPDHGHRPLRRPPTRSARHAGHKSLRRAGVTLEKRSAPEGTSTGWLTKITVACGASSAQRYRTFGQVMITAGPDALYEYRSAQRCGGQSTSPKRRKKQAR